MEYSVQAVTFSTDGISSTGVKILGADSVFVEVSSFKCSGATVGYNPQVSYDGSTYRDVWCLTRASGLAGIRNQKLIINQSTGNHTAKIPIQGFTYLRLVTNLTATASYSVNVHVSR